MGQIVTKLKDLFELEGNPLPKEVDLAYVTPLVLEKYSFLPNPIAVRVEGDSVIISYPDEQDAAREEAVRLASRAAKRAGEGDYEKAVSLWKRVLELQPSFHIARRDLAMAYVELRDPESAKNHLIEVLRLNPGDAGSLVVLANIYAQNDKDYATAERFLKRALETAPQDAWALNSLAAVMLETQRPDEGLALFRQSVAANPAFANPYFGLAVALARRDRLDEAVTTLHSLFAHAKEQDARSRPAFEQARRLFVTTQERLAEKKHEDAFRAVEDFRASLERLSGYPIKTIQEEFEDRLGATIQMAWKYGRDYHVIKCRESFPEQLKPHLMAHELSHLRLESEARQVGKNLFFTTSARSRELAIRSLGDDVRRWQKRGHDEQKITDVIITLVGGLSAFVFNCPLDMLIETSLRQQMPALSASQFLSLRLMAAEAWQSSTSTQARELTPRAILRAGLALNGAYALFLDSLFQGATSYASNYRNADNFNMAQKLWQHWQAKSPKLGPGGEYGLVDDFADMLRIREWYDWRPDPGHHEATAEPLKEGTTNPALLKQQQPAAIFYFLDAFKRFEAMTQEQVRNVALEIAILGRSGLDYAAPDEKYELRSLPDRKFSGLHLMCLMYAGFKRVAPEHDVQMELNDSFLAALQMHKPGGAK